MSEETRSPYEAKKERYIEILRPLFMPDDPVSNDIVNYFASLLRIFGMEDSGWDPYAESRATFDDMNGFFEVNLPEDLFPDPNATHWRIGLVLYSHIVEMDAPYDVLTNLLRFRLDKGYNPNAFFEFLTDKERGRFGKHRILTERKIKIIEKLSTEAKLPEVGAILDDFYDNRLRNAIAHSDYILTNTDFQCRGGDRGTNAFRIPYERLDDMLVSAKAFIAAFFQVELWARQYWGLTKHRAVPYDPYYKGLMEVLVDVRDAMCGFRVHWPNGSESTYRRTEDGTEMINCHFDPESATIALFVGLYAQEAGEFSPLVECDAEPVYSKLEDCDVIPTWPNDA